MIHPNFHASLPSLIEILDRNKVVAAYLFGSVVSETFNAESDVDLLIRFNGEVSDPLERGELWWTLHDELREKLNREIDLLTEKSLKNPYLIKEIDNTKVKVHG
ncbi:MAG: nucleotidyltransferase domain-containing protein [Cytophagales bacterium]|nr:nucleotidyltransferase domain-containing protein [Cytophagales bacterium]